MQCHLETTSSRLPHSILKMDRGAFSYRPGTPLSDYVLHFDHAPGGGRDDKFEIAHHAYRLRKSACFEKSAGKMTCTTCHDPHAAPRGKAAVERYTSVCRNCHPGVSAIRNHPAGTNCLECHMPKRRTEDVVHVVMTDHYIQRRKRARDLLAELPERHESGAAYHGPVVAYYPKELASTAEGSLYLSLAQVKQFTNLKEGIPQLEQAILQSKPNSGEFHFELAEAYEESGRLPDAVRSYEEALRRSPGFVPAILGWARSLSKSGEHEKAEALLRRALSAEPRDAAVLHLLGVVELREGKAREAAESLRAAAAIEPENAEVFQNLGGALQQAGDPAAAETAYRQSLRLLTSSAGVHRSLASLLASKGDLPQAEFHFLKAIYHDPADAAARFEYGMALASSGHTETARIQLTDSVRLNPRWALAQSALADMLAMEGKTQAAIEHYRSALEVEPENLPAHLGLGSALASLSRSDEAVAHLEKAAGSADPQIRQAAVEALRALGRPTGKR
jgi:predicted CXXCH cytochrome family protein